MLARLPVKNKSPQSIAQIVNMIRFGFELLAIHVVLMAQLTSEGKN